MGPGYSSPHVYDVAIVGSGFGGSVAALRLSEKGYRVVVFEAGRRFNPADFPRSNWRLRRYLWVPWLGWRGIQRMTLLDDVLVLSGAGVGGGSLVYANTLVEPLPGFFADRQWSGITDWQTELAPYYDQAKRMLGSTPTPIATPADEITAGIARHFGAADTHRPTDVGVWFGEPGTTVADPYFGGAGPDRTGCRHCGGCMVGCRHGAKNTLDHNYLYLAERLGAEVLAEHEVTDMRRVGGGWQLHSRRPGPIPRARATVTARQVVFAAGALGTTRLLLRLAGRGRLLAVEGLGELVRTNSEAIVGAVSRGRTVDYSKGVAITSSFRPSPDTTIEPVRYPAGSNAMGLLGTILVDPDRPGGRLRRFLAAMGSDPGAFLRSLSVRRWSERAVIVLVMQSRDNSIRVSLGRRRLRTSPGHGEANPRHLPVAHEAARAAADLMGGDPAGSVTESLLDVPVTAHIIGGAVIGTGPGSGVVDAYHRIFGYPDLHVFDGAAVPANPGANPSLTITALAERAAALWPNAGEPDRRPIQGEPYRRLDPVAPRHPAVPAAAPAALCW